MTQLAAYLTKPDMRYAVLMTSMCYDAGIGFQLPL